MASVSDSINISIWDKIQKKEVEAELSAVQDGLSLSCQVKVKGKKVGSMTLRLGQKQVSVILLNNEDEKRFAHVGKQLIEYAKAYSKAKGKKGKISTFAMYNSHSFYYLLGLRSLDRVKNSFIEKAIESAKLANKKADTTALNGLYMEN